MNRSDFIYQTLELMYPDAHCQLDYQTPFQLAVAVVLSAQTTDVAVNRVTKKLFARYPDCQALAEASLSDLEECLHELGLYHNKARNISQLAKEVLRNYNGVLPDTFDELTKLPGVGVKCANVIMAECYHVPSFAVDTHVNRIARRLQIAEQSDSITTVEKKLKGYFPKERWIRMHHLLIFFGRNKCYARKPDCNNCPFAEFCYEKNH